MELQSPSSHDFECVLSSPVSLLSHGRVHVLPCFVNTWETLSFSLLCLLQPARRLGEMLVKALTRARNKPKCIKGDIPRHKQQKTKENNNAQTEDMTNDLSAPLWRSKAAEPSTGTDRTGSVLIAAPVLASLRQTVPSSGRKL